MERGVGELIKENQLVHEKEEEYNKLQREIEVMQAQIDENKEVISGLKLINENFAQKLNKKEQKVRRQLDQ